MAGKSLDDLGRFIETELKAYGQEATDTMREVVSAITDEAVETLKVTSPKRRGKYGKGWRSKVTEDTTTGLTKTIHNRTPGLTHLLEDGHAKQNGGRVEGKKHIAPVEQSAVKAFETQLRQKL